jgi:hypothetical protein
MSANLTRRVQTPRALCNALAPTLLAGMLLAPLLIGCQAAGPRAATPLTVPSDTNAELVEYISDQPYVSAEAAYRAVFILAKGEIFHGDYDALATEMRTSGLIGQTWSYAPETFVDRAAVGFLVARACHIRSGLNWQLTGLGRYAYRELIFRRIAHPSGELGLISGGEFLGVLARAEEYLRKVGRSPEPTAELGEPQAK